MHPPRTPAETEAVLAAELRTARPALLSPYTAELPGARAAVLTRLWRGLVHEPLPWVARREAAGRDGLVLRLADGRRLHGPASDAYATGATVMEVELDGTAYRHPAALMTALGLPHGHAFAVELGHSVASLALSRANQPAPSSPFTSWEWEQRVVDGHPFHPNCRSRPGFSVAEQLAYAPEHRADVELGLMAVPEGGCLVGGQWPYREAGRVLIPVHPWQARHVLKDERAVGEGVAGESLAAHPLMSLRTLALPDGPHVKTALSARLTSSVRDISVYSIESAAAVSAFMEAMAGRLDGMLHITRTLGAVTANTPDLAAVLRESPDVYAGTGERVVPVAALASTVLPQSPAWLAEFSRLALAVGLRLLDLGVALEAHGQNLLVVLSPAGAPLRLVYRDLADIRISPARLARHGIPAPDLTGRIVTDDESVLRSKLFGSLVAGALAATAGSATALGEALSTAVRDLPRTPDLAALLEEPLPAKALATMRLSPERPGDIWARLPNPLADPDVTPPRPSF
ncbi:IucA/IucC family protein [Streptomyces liliifuscus]|uniref:IucA/IucC family siderophore biosynthesis protein n=1 Tax=Streptomyces liliifuscus TaxID=2797636 RepID=A0A7T7I315_9ACTN|nr:IucA/IucC family siderophore biosynthesis protein [Streptomyces liliifuscus]QQM39943.1 IucA/IucC family siderophore biosynthesis protein [Streptomyces liliifuscus]